MLYVKEIVEIRQQGTGDQLIRVQFTDQLWQFYLALDIAQKNMPLSSSNNNNKPVGDWISAPSPNVVDPQTMTQTMTDSVTHR